MILRILVFVAIASTCFATVQMQQDFTPAQNGTLPTGLTGSYDSGTDVSVVPFGTIVPAPPADHTGGDGYVLRVGDINAGGGFYNWAGLTTANAQADCSVSAWVYLELTTGDATFLEREVFVACRMQTTDPQLPDSANRHHGYMLLISRAASWTGITPNPTDRMPYLMGRQNVASGNYFYVGTPGTTAVADGWHQLKIEATGTTIKGYVDNVVVCQGTDSTYTSGNPAIGYYEANGAASSYPYAAAFDNFLYETPTILSASDWQLY